MNLKTALAAALVVAVSLSFSQRGGHAGHSSQGQPPKAEHSAGGMKMAACMRDMSAAQKKLDALTAKMNSSQGADRIDATTEVVNELVKEHRNMMRMCHMMMGAHGMGHSAMAPSGAKEPPAQHKHDDHK